MIVRLRKLSELEEALHPNNIEEGFITEIDLGDHPFNPPTVGERFTLIGYMRWFSTSMVTEIIDEKTFKTLNSIYQWEVVDLEED
jgi:hypothetical protein